MIRNVVMGRLRAAADPESAAADEAVLDAALAGIAALQLPGLVSMEVGRDAGLRVGGWSFAITNVWADEDAYRFYDLEEEHNRYRAMIVGVCDDVARVQFPV